MRSYLKCLIIHARVYLNFILQQTYKRQPIMIVNKFKVFLAVLCSLITCQSIYAYDFNGNYTGTGKGLIGIEINSKQVHAIARCSPANCDWKTNKISTLNNGNTMIVELKPLESNDKTSTLYSTIVLTPTNIPNKIQASLISYRQFASQTESTDYNSASSATVVLTKKIAQ